MICKWVFTFVSIFHCPLLALLHKSQTYIYIYTYMWPWTTKAVLSRTVIFIANNILHGSKLYIFFLCEKSSGHYVEIMFHEDIFPTINISKLNFWYVLCIAKNLIWTTWKMIFSIFRFVLHLQIFTLLRLWPHLVHKYKTVQYWVQCLLISRTENVVRAEG